jgi:Zn-dependent protease
MFDITYYLLMIPGILIALTVHECAHGYAAYRLGDPTARSLGRLTLNPIKHIDPIGALAMIFFRIGWAKPVPINVRYFRKPRRDMAITALAGPLSNLLLSFFSVFFALLFFKGYVGSIADGSFPFLTKLLYFAYYFFFLFHVLNLSLCLFNLLPLPPLDGSRLISLVLPKKAYYWLLQHERQIYLGVLIWLILGGRLARMLLQLQIVASTPVLYYLVQFLSFFLWISSAVYILMWLFFILWSLLPFLA